MKRFNKKVTLNSKMVSVGFILLALVIMAGASYAYFSSKARGTSQNLKVTTGTMKLSLSGTTNVSCENIFPGGSCLVYFTVTNEGTLPTSYGIDLINVSNTFINDELVYSIASTNNGGARSETIAPNENSSLLNFVQIDAGTSQSYVMTILFKETGEDQNINQSAEFEGLIQINNLINGKQKLIDAILNSQVVTSGEGLYVAQGDNITENNLPTYYYRGNNVNNYLSLNGNMYRIVRLNEDGSIRIMSTTPVYPSTNSSKTRYNNTESSTYNTEMIGYTYTHNALKNWYNSNLASTEYDSLVLKNGKFCNDTSLVAYGSDDYINAARRRVSSSTPQFKCPVSPLELPYGLITADEYLYSGASNSYMYGTVFWTMTPYSSSSIFYINTNNTGGIGSRNPTDLAPRTYPVLNLASDVIVVGQGSSDNPYYVLVK